MSYIQFEDDTGSIELIAFQRALDTGGPYIKDGATLLIGGRISVRDEKEPQITVDSIEPLEGISLSDLPSAPENKAPEPKAPPKPPVLYVKLPSIEDKMLNYIELLLTMFPGTGKMVIWCEKEKRRIGASCLIHDALILELTERLGAENVVLK